jgi:hypothetical protein
MADKKISALTAASTPLAGSEVLPIVQSGSTVKVSVANLTVGRAVTATDFTARKAAGGTFVFDSTAVGTTNNIYSTANNGNALADLNYSANAHNWNYGATPLASTDPNGTYKIFTLGSECIRVSINDMTNYKGNYIVGTAGKGIDFSAATHAAGMTSELLNDYEEGTWTPVPTTSTGTYTTITASGSYVKVGRIVCVSFDIVFNNIGTATECDTVQGLPYAAGTQSGSGAFREYTNQGDMWSTTVLPSTTEFITRTYANGKNVSNGDRFTGSFTYITA